MNILIIGSGAREHAIARALKRSSQKPQLFCCGTSYNPGIEELTKGYWVGDITDSKQIIQAIQDWPIDFAFIGPEGPLEKGVADDLWAIDVPVIGPKKNLAQLESSKSFTRDLMQRHQIPGLPSFKAFSDMTGVAEFLNELGEGNYVVKANGLMAGKGVKVAGDHLHSFADAIEFCQEILDQQQSFVIEEKLVGQEFSLMCFTDGLTLAPMPLVQDNKRAFESDKGPNTGGMGSFSSADHGLPFLQERDAQEALQISQQVLEAVCKETQDRYIGILYGGFIATVRGVYVIEFNARFGDPEALNVLSLIESDLVELCQDLIQGCLKPDQIRFAAKATVCKYAVPHGYPDHPLRHGVINIDSVNNKEHLYLAAVNAEAGILYATGSRAAAYVGVADTLSEAELIAETEIVNIKGELFHRKDIGTAALIDQRIQAMHRLRETPCA